MPILGRWRRCKLVALLYRIAPHGFQRHTAQYSSALLLLAVRRAARGCGMEAAMEIERNLAAEKERPLGFQLSLIKRERIGRESRPYTTSHQKS